MKKNKLGIRLNDDIKRCLFKQHFCYNSTPQNVRKIYILITYVTFNTFKLTFRLVKKLIFCLFLT